jgi:hypothetical protein
LDSTTLRRLPSDCRVAPVIDSSDRSPSDPSLTSGISPAADITCMTTSSAEGQPPEPISPELVLVDPALRRQLLVSLKQTLPPMRSVLLPIESAHRVSAPERIRSGTANTAASARRSPLERTCLAIAWTTAAAAVATSLTLGLLQRPASTETTQASSQAGPAPVVVVAPYTPAPTQTQHRSASDRRRLAQLLQAPMRDPFAPARQRGG